MRRLFRIISVLLVCLILSSCKSGGEKPSQPAVKLEDATQVEQILDQMNRGNNLNMMVYSELKDYEEFLGYFDLLMSYDFNYLLFDIDGGRYMFMMYRFTKTTEKLDEVKNVRKNYTGDKLSLVFETESHPDSSDKGCFPQPTHVRCILKVDDGFDPGKCTVSVFGYGTPVIEKYQGGVVFVDDKCGFVDADLNIKHPIGDGRINEFESDRVDGYYWNVEHGVMGLLDHYGNVVLSQSYNRIICINPDRFIVERKEKNNSYSIGLVDSHENIIHDFIPGEIEMQRIGIYNAAGQFIFKRNSASGVIDENLNIVIEPDYLSIADYYSDCPNMFYAVENREWKFAVIGSDGELKTEFIYDEAYDAYQAYFNAMGGYGSDFFKKAE